MELFSFLLFIITGLFFYTRGDRVLRESFQEWRWRFKVAKALGYKNILRTCYNTISMTCLILIRVFLMKLNKKFSVNTNINSVELCSTDEIKALKYYDKHLAYYKLTFFINKNKVCKVISVSDNDIYPIMITKSGKDITNEITPYFENNIQFEEIDWKFFGKDFIINFNDGSEKIIN
jgi:hypothetical protein